MDMPLGKKGTILMRPKLARFALTRYRGRSERGRGKRFKCGAGEGKSIPQGEGAQSLFDEQTSLTREG